jgi:hypothetical protein
MACLKHIHVTCSCEEPCPQCRKEVFYSETHDSFFCWSCNIWTEPTCGLPGCGICGPRPELPNEEPRKA